MIMKLSVFDSAKKETKKIDLPSQFNEEVRTDVIRRAVEVLQSRNRQPYGATPEAGKKASTKLSRRRHDYKTSYGAGISRVPRKILSRKGTRMSWVGALAPGTVGGRRAHPPKPVKVWEKKLNRLEERKAVRSAMAATMKKEVVAARGHKVPDDYPFILDRKTETIQKTSEVKKMMISLGLEEEITRAAIKTIRAGKGKGRGRRYVRKKGPLIVVGDVCPLSKSGSNIAGFEIRKISEINAEDLAPGGNAGRLTLFTESAIERLGKEKLFTRTPAAQPKQKKAEQGA